MAKSLAQIQKQIDALQREADAIKASEKSGVVARIKEAIAHYGITAAELGLGKGGVRGPRGPYKKRAQSRATAAKKAGKQPNGVVKYRDDAGNTWSGRGPKPRWFKAALDAGKKPDDLKA